MGRKNYSDGSQNTAWDYVLGTGPSSGAALAVGASVPLNCEDIFSVASMQLVYPSAPASVSVNLEGSLDGVNWTVLATSTATTTNSVQSTGVQFRLLRANVTATSGGSSPTIVAIVAAVPGSTIGGTADVQTVQAATGSITPTPSLTAQTAVANGTTVDFGHAVQEIAFSVVPNGTVTSGAVTFQISADGTNWSTPPAAAMTSNSAYTAANPLSVLSATGVGVLTVNFGAVRYARANISTLIGGGGTVSVSISGA